MTALLEKLAEDLARDTMEHAERVGDDKIIEEVAKTLADTSSTFQEAFLTAIRYYRADARAREVLPDTLQALPKPNRAEQKASQEAKAADAKEKAENEVPTATVNIVDED